ncbi:hypothetical protein BGX29_006349 [Mortierella sp. GBA35]|nr:hypothetical protein BGX29_006349 [Mortierella sp. GBA35]
MASNSMADNSNNIQHSVQELLALAKTQSNILEQLMQRMDTQTERMDDISRENPPAIVLGSLLRKDHRLWDRSLSQHPEGELESGNEEMEVEQGGGVGVDSEGENEAEVDERIVRALQQLPPVIVVDLAPDVVYWDLTPSLEPFLNKWFNSEGNNASVWRLERLRRTQGPTFHDLWSSAKGVTQAEILRVGSMSSYSQPFGGGRGNKHQDRLRRRRYRRI